MQGEKITENLNKLKEILSVRNIQTNAINELLPEKDTVNECCSLFDYLKADFELEVDFLKHIYSLEEKFKIHFFPFNWPKGYRFESAFYAYIVFSMSLQDYREYKNYYKIRIEEDLVFKKRHRVIFYFPSLNLEVTICDILKKLQREIIVGDSICHELVMLSSLTSSELETVGQLYSGLDNLSIEKGEKVSNQDGLLIAYIKLLRDRHNFILLQNIHTESSAILEGVLWFEPIFKSQNKVVYRELEKYFLTIRIINGDFTKIYFSYCNQLASLSDILEYGGIKNEVTNDDLKVLISMSNYELNIIALILEEMFSQK